MGPQPQYNGLNILGAGQKAAGIPGADVGKPVLDQGGPCKWNDGCVHPKPGSPAAEAVGEAFWDLFFSMHVNGATLPTQHPTPPPTPVQTSSLAPTPLPTPVPTPGPTQEQLQTPRPTSTPTPTSTMLDPTPVP